MDYYPIVVAGLCLTQEHPHRLRTSVMGRVRERVTLTPSNPDLLTLLASLGKPSLCCGGDRQGAPGERKQGAWPQDQVGDHRG